MGNYIEYNDTIAFHPGYYIKAVSYTHLPSLIAKEGRDFTEVIKEITSIVDGPISGEVKATTVDAEGLSLIHI